MGNKLQILPFFRVANSHNNYKYDTLEHTIINKRVSEHL